MRTNRCACGQPAPDAAICGACTRALQLALISAVALCGDLELAISKQVKFKESVGRGQSPSLPFDPRASDAAWVLRNTLSGWVRVLAEMAPQRARSAADARTLPPGYHRVAPSDPGSSDGFPADTIDAMAMWLLRRMGALRQHEAACECVREIAAAVTNAMHAVDRPVERVFIGPCDDCGADVYARPGTSHAECGCGARYDVQERRDQMLAMAEDILGTAAEISRALTRYGRPVTPSAIRGLMFRGRLTSHGQDNLRRSLFRVGDVLDAITRDNWVSPRARQHPGDTANLTS